MTVFIISGKAVGLAAGESKETMGLRGCPVADLVFNNVVASDAAMSEEIVRRLNKSDWNDQEDQWAL